MKTCIIIATDEKGGLGKNNKMPWNLPLELEYFKQTTLNHCVIMGRRTYESIGKPLKDRYNIVLSKNENLQIPGVEVVNSLEASIEAAQKHIASNDKIKSDEIFIIGGAQVYKEFIYNDLVNRIYFTRINGRFECDSFIRPLNMKEWDIVSHIFVPKDEKNEYPYTKYIFDRNNKGKN